MFFAQISILFHQHTTQMFPAKFENSWSDLNAGDLVLDPCLHFSKDTESGTSSSSACHSALKGFSELF